MSACFQLLGSFVFQFCLSQPFPPSCRHPWASLSRALPIFFFDHGDEGLFAPLSVSPHKHATFGGARPWLTVVPLRIFYSFLNGFYRVALPPPSLWAHLDLGDHLSGTSSSSPPVAFLYRLGPVADSRFGFADFFLSFWACPGLFSPF